MRCIFRFEIELDETIHTKDDMDREARSIRDTYFKPETFTGLLIHTDADGEDVIFELTEDDKIIQYG